MRRHAQLAAVLLALAALAPASAVAASPAAPGPAPAPAPSPAGGHIALRVRAAHARGSHVFVGQRLAIEGTVAPYVAGQRVRVRVSLDNRHGRTRTLKVAPAMGATGRFRLAWISRSGGVLRVAATHRATSAQGAFTARPVALSVLDPVLSSGARGPAVRLLQAQLAHLHYALDRSGTFDAATARAVIAYRKVTGESLHERTDLHLFGLLQRGAGAFRVRFPGHGKHIEADLHRQVLAQIDRGGHVRLIYTMSSGKPSTPTVTGDFRVYSKTPGTNSKGMVDASYFIAGYAIHGYAQVPAYAASHGCLRIPIPNAASMFAWLSVGDRVDVYSGSRGGNHRVSRNAGP